eukprot:sb/3476253/
MQTSGNYHPTTSGDYNTSADWHWFLYNIYNTPAEIQDAFTGDAFALKMANPTNYELNDNYKIAVDNVYGEIWLSRVMSVFSIGASTFCSILILYTILSRRKIGMAIHVSVVTYAISMVN